MLDFQPFGTDWLTCIDPLGCNPPPCEAEGGEEFEAMVTADLDMSPWTVLAGTPAVIAGGAGASMQCVQLNPGDEERLTADGSLYAGTVQFDLYIASGATGRWTAEDTAGWRMGRFYFRDGGAAVDIATSIGGTNLVTGVMAFDTWTKFRFSFDNDTELFALEIDCSPVYTDMAFNEAGQGHDYSGDPLDFLEWDMTAGGDILFDSVAVESAGP